VVDLADVERHLGSCSGCAERLRDVEIEYAILRRPEVWRDRSSEDVGPNLAAKFGEVAAQLARDDKRAGAIYTELLERPAETWLEHLAVTTGWNSDALVKRIVADARQEEERDPRRALTLLDTAESITTLQPTSDGGATIWKQRANTLMALGSYAKALDALDRADALYTQMHAGAFDFAFTMWARANIVFQMGTYAEAQRLARSAAATFEEYGDAQRAARVGVLIASIYYEEGRIREAERLFRKLAPTFEENGDRLTSARITANLACCMLAQDQTAKADEFARRAMDFFSRDGREAEVLRTRWALALVRMRKHDREGGLANLREVADGFENLGAVVDAAEVRLSVVEELLRCGDFSGAADILVGIAATFVASGVRAGLAKALEFLREATRTQTATPRDVRVVRHVLVHPEQPFELPSA
jgi:tetratricopeptide (TPR) repeat protein